MRSQVDINFGGHCSAQDVEARGKWEVIHVAAMVREPMVAQSRVVAKAGEGVPEVLGSCAVRTWL